MATRTDTVTVDSAAAGLLTAVGGTVTANDTVWIGKDQLYTYAGAQNLGQDLVLVGIQASHRKRITGLKFNATAGAVKLNGAGDLYEISSLGSAAVHADVQVDLAGPGRVNYSDATITALRVVRGMFQAGTDCVVTNCYCSGGETHLLSGASAGTTFQFSGDAIGRVDRDVATINAKDRAKVIINSSTCTPATGIFPEGGTVEFHECGTVAAIGVAAGGAEGVLDFSRLKFPMTVSAIYHSKKLTIILPRHAPDLVTFSSTNTANGNATVVYA